MSKETKQPGADDAVERVTEDHLADLTGMPEPEDDPRESEISIAEATAEAAAAAGQEAVEADPGPAHDPEVPAAGEPEAGAEPTLDERIAAGVAAARKGWDAEREHERQGFVRALQETRERARDLPAMDPHLQPGQPQGSPWNQPGGMVQPGQAPQYAPPPPQGQPPHPGYQGGMPQGVPVYDDFGERTGFLRPEELARYLPQAPAAQGPNPAMAYQAQQQEVRRGLIDRDPVTYAQPVNRVWELYGELDREVTAANATRFGGTVDFARLGLEGTLDFIQQSGIARGMAERHPELVSEQAVLELAEAGVTNSPRRLSRAVDGLRYAMAGAAAGQVPGSPGTPALDPPLVPAAVPSNVQRLPTERPRPMGQKGRATVVEETGPRARYAELSKIDPLKLNDAQREELDELDRVLDEEDDEKAARGA